jgi:hypothetical protein
MTDFPDALSPEARATLNALRNAHDPPSDAILRARPHIDARIRKREISVRVLRWGAVAGIAALVAMIAFRSSPTLTSVAPPSPAVPTVERQALVVPVVPVQVVEAGVVHEVVADTPRVAVRAAPSVCTMDIETRALHAADGALRTGDTTTTLRLVRELARQCPRGSMIQEREALRVMARCKTNAPSHLQEASEFLRRWPRSPARGRVELLCEIH